MVRALQNLKICDGPVIRMILAWQIGGQTFNEVAAAIFTGTGAKNVRNGKRNVAPPRESGIFVGRGCVVLGNQECARYP